MPITQTDLGKPTTLAGTSAYKRKNRSLTPNHLRNIYNLAFGPNRAHTQLKHNTPKRT